MPTEILYIVAVLVVSTVLLVDKLITSKHINNLTEALADVRSDKDFIDHASELATEVIPSDLAHRILDMTQSFADLAKFFAPDNIDSDIDQGVEIEKEILGQSAKTPPQ